MIIFIPLFFAAFLSLLSFVMNVENVVGKFRLSISAVTALLGYRFVIERIMPQVSYFTSTDSIYTFLLIFTFIIFLIQLLITRHFMVLAPKLKEEQETKLKKKIEQTSSIIFIIMSILLVITTTYIILT